MFLGFGKGRFGFGVEMESDGDREGSFCFVTIVFWERPKGISSWPSKKIVSGFALGLHVGRGSGNGLGLGLPGRDESGSDDCGGLKRRLVLFK